MSSRKPGSLLSWDSILGVDEDEKKRNKQTEREAKVQREYASKTSGFTILLETEKCMACIPWQKACDAGSVSLMYLLSCLLLSLSFSISWDGDDKTERCRKRTEHINR